MTELEHAFLEDQRGSRSGYCTSFVDKKWERTTQRRHREELAYEKMKRAEETSQPEAVPWGQVSSEMVQGDSTASEDDAEQNYNASTTDSECDTQPTKMRRVSIVHEATSDIMPEKFRHIRSSIKHVKPEFYSTVDKLISSNHCSKNQAVSTVITVANEMFGRQ